MCASACGLFCPHSRAWPHTHAACGADSPFPLCHISVCHTRRPFVGCPLWTRQSADAFSQPLSFDTSSVTDMNGMFRVRFHLSPSAHTLPNCGPHTHTACAADVPFPLCHLFVPRASLCRMSPLDSAECVSFQPAAELGHLQRHRHEPHVRGALPPACAFCPHAPELGHTRTPYALLIRPSLCATHLRVPHASSLCWMPLLNSAACACFQSAAELRHLQRHRHEQHVRCALPRLRLFCPHSRRAGPISWATFPHR
jgi:hypothetical protein